MLPLCYTYWELWCESWHAWSVDHHSHGWSTPVFLDIYEKCMCIPYCFSSMVKINRWQRSDMPVFCCKTTNKRRTVDYLNHIPQALSQLFEICTVDPYWISLFMSISDCISSFSLSFLTTSIHVKSCLSLLVLHASTKIKVSPSYWKWSICQLLFHMAIPYLSVYQVVLHLCNSYRSLYILVSHFLFPIFSMPVFCCIQFVFWDPLYCPTF